MCYLVGHKRGSPLFDQGVCTLVRAGGDGLLRLWGTKAAESYREIARIPNRKSPYNGNKSTLQKSQSDAYHTVHEFNPCGAAIAARSDDSNIHIWNAQGLTFLGTQTDGFRSPLRQKRIHFHLQQ